jgi:hypothetical protein
MLRSMISLSIKLFASLGLKTISVIIALIFVSVKYFMLKSPALKADGLNPGKESGIIAARRLDRGDDRHGLLYVGTYGYYFEEFLPNYESFVYHPWLQGESI